MTAGTAAILFNARGREVDEVAVVGERVSVGTGATKLADGGQRVVIVNGGGASVFLGGPNVTASTGVTLANGEKLTVELDAVDDALYACTASGTNVVQVLRSRLTG